MPPNMLLSQVQWLPVHDEAAELARLQAARLKVATMLAEARRAEIAG